MRSALTSITVLFPRIDLGRLKQRGGVFLSPRYHRLHLTSRLSTVAKPMGMQLQGKDKRHQKMKIPFQSTMPKRGLTVKPRLVEPHLSSAQLVTSASSGIKTHQIQTMETTMLITTEDRHREG